MRIAGLLMLAIFMPVSAFAAGLVNINTADTTLLSTLSGIGPAKAAAIIDYRTQHGPFARSEDIQNVSGIGPSTYAGIKDFITVLDTNVSDTRAAVSAASSTPASTSVAVSESSNTSVTQSSTLSVHVSGDSVAFLEVPVRLSARVVGKGAPQISWSFGDGSSSTGTVVEKTYRYAGTYLVVATVTDGSTTVHDDLTVTVKPAAVSIALVSGEGITLANDSSARLDLSGWRLLSGLGTFRFPEGTALLPGARVLFPFSVMNLPVASDPILTYPDGVVAAHSAPSAAPIPAIAPPSSVQPSTGPVSYSGGAKVETVTRTTPNIQPHDDAVLAPAAATDLAAAGAALPPPETGAAKPASSSVFRSPWTLGLFGVIAAAGGAFILL